MEATIEVGNLYDAKTDAEFQKPYIDIDEWREGAVRYRYIHGGFEGTKTRFSFFFPEEGQYKGRFFQHMAPAPNHENASIGRQGEEDKIAFAITHGAYYVESNMGVTEPFMPVADHTIYYRASAAAAEYSRVVAAEFFGEHRPYGYIYGGSGGGYKSTSCFENTNTWDGAVPYIIGSPMSIPNMFTVRALAKRVLRNKLHIIADAMEPGGDENFIDMLTDEEKNAWWEVTKLGYPTRSWFFYETMDDGALPVLTPGIERVDSKYYKDFWEVPGYDGADPESSAVRDRIQFNTTVVEVYIPDRDGKYKPDHQTGADESWKRNRGDKGMSLRPLIKFESTPGVNKYYNGTRIICTSGEAAGYSFPLESIDNDVVTVAAGFGQSDMLDKLALVKPGDKVRFDNSDYIAIQYYHRHQVPDAGYKAWDQFRDENGLPKYPQREFLVGPMISMGGCGSIQSGRFKGKMIVLATLMDESAFPWQPDWYRQRVKEALGDRESESFRLWYIDNALHDDRSNTIDELHLISYLGALHQAVLDVANWVENDIPPADSSVYTIDDGQLYVSNDANKRKGLQPVVNLTVNGGKKATISCGESVYLNAVVELPENTGKLTEAHWNFEGKSGYTIDGALSEMDPDGTKAMVEAVYSFTKPGTYFPGLRVKAQRNGNEKDIFTQVKNLDRVRVIVE